MQSSTSGMYFTQTKLKRLGKKGELKPDENGYYELVVGALNVNNNSGIRYIADGVRELFGPGSLLHRRIANGCLRAEVGHPKPRPGEKHESFVERYLDIDRKNTCAHFKDIWLDENFGKNNPEYNNPSLVAIMARVKPSEPYGHILKESLDNAAENVCFSIRALCDEALVAGRVVRILKEVITIDFVNEGGILVASKWDSPATESIGDLVTEKLAGKITEDLLKRVMATSGVMASESSREAANIILVNHFSPSRAPVYANW